MKMFPILHAFNLTVCLSACLILPLGLTGCGSDEGSDSGDAANSGPNERMGGGGAGGDAAGGGGIPISGAVASEKQVATDPDGNPVTLYQLTNSHGMQVEIINWGAVVTSIRVPDRNERFENVTLGFDKPEDYFKPGPYFGAICGRYSNRIAAGKFQIGDQSFQLATNNDANHLHGGERGFNRRAWSGKLVKQDGAVGVALSLKSPDGEENYPGTLSVNVTYWVTDRGELKIEYQATTDKPTVLNLTNHCYWNLAGAGNGTILDHQLTLDCDAYLPVDDTLIPTGERAPVAGTPMDFTSAHAIGSRIDKVEGGYDHCYVINRDDNSLKPVAEIFDPDSGRVMEILTTEPGVQFYTGNFLDGEAGNGGFPLHGGFCLETQHFPDSPNQPDFPSTLLKPGDAYTQTTVHRFSVRREEPPAASKRGSRRSSKKGSRKGSKDAPAKDAPDRKPEGPGTKSN